MRRPLLAAAAAVAALLTSVALAPSAGAAPSPTGIENRNTPVCGPPAAGFASCHAIRHEVIDGNGRSVAPQATAGISGLDSSDIRSAYGLAGASSGRRVVAIVDAYHSPRAADELTTYRAKTGLTACTTDTGCFRQLNQSGQPGQYPAVDVGWAQEIALDLDMVSATCPDCQIVLVEANSASFADLAAAVDTAAGIEGVVAISNSYGGRDFSSTLAKSYDHPNIAITASTGDNGYGVSAPASFPGVVAVGGTSLRTATTSRGWTETAWTGAGSGCSKYSTNTRNWQSSTVTGCAYKATADVSAVADPNTGVAVFGPTSGTASGWMVFGGTSASTPIIASVYAMGKSVGNTAYPAANTWKKAAYGTVAIPGTLNDVTSGSNGKCSGTNRSWCTAVAGWDGPTGLGTPHGTDGF